MVRAAWSGVLAIIGILCVFGAIILIYEGMVNDILLVLLMPIALSLLLLSMILFTLAELELAVGRALSSMIKHKHSISVEDVRRIRRMIAGMEEAEAYETKLRGAFEAGRISESEFKSGLANVGLPVPRDITDE